MPLAPIFTAAVPKAWIPVGLGILNTPSLLVVLPIATISGEAVLEADSKKVFKPVWEGAGLVLIQSKTIGIFVAEKAADGVMPNTKFWLPPAGILTGVFGLPINSLVALVV
jgi:hypothetical protein